MKTFLNSAALAAALVAAPALLAPAQAQVAAGQGTAVVDLEGAVARSAAFQAASRQIQTTYKTQIDAFNARTQALNTELQPLQRELQTLQQNPATPKATLDSKVNAYRTRAAAAQTELQRLAQPFGRPTAYAREQVAQQIEPALRAAMTAKRVNLVVSPEAAVLALPGGDITPDVVTQLNALVKTVSATPPANWQPGQTRQAAQPASPQGR